MGRSEAINLDSLKRAAVLVDEPPPKAGLASYWPDFIEEVVKPAAPQWVKVPGLGTSAPSVKKNYRLEAVSRSNGNGKTDLYVRAV